MERIAANAGGVKLNMRKHRGESSRRHPRFDLLEERSLLSAGFPPANIHPGGFISPQFLTDHVNFPVPEDRGFTISVSFHWESPLPSDPSWPSLLNNPQLPDPDVSVQGPAPAASVPQVSVSIAVPTGYQAPNRNEPGPIAQSPENSAQSFGVPAVGNAKNQSSPNEGGRDGADRVSVSAGAEVILAGTSSVAVAAVGKDVAQDVGGNSNSQLEQAVPSPPAQPATLSERDALFVNGWLDARYRALSGVDQPSVAGLIGTDRSTNDQGHIATLIPTTMSIASDGSPLAGGGPAVLPNPPHSADLIANVFPCDGGALDRAIDQFFKQVDELDGSGAGGQDPARIVFLAGALVGSFAGLDIVRRRWRHWKANGDDRVRDPVGGGEHIGFPELPGSWSSRLT